MKSLIKFSVVVSYLVVAVVGDILPAEADPTVQSSDYKIEFLANGLGAATGMALRPDGNLYVTDDAGFNVLRIQDPSSSGPHTAEMYVNGVQFPNDLTFAFGGRLLVTSPNSTRSPLLEVLSNKSLQTFACCFSFPIGIATFGNYVYVGNSGDGTISRVDSSGASSILVSGFGGPHGPFGLSFDSVGNLYFIVHGSGEIYKADPSGATQLIGSVTPFGGVFVAATPDGTLFVSDVLQGAVYLVNQTGVHLLASGFAGKSNPPFNGPNDLVLDSAGRLYVADAGNVWRLSPTFPQTSVLDTFNRANGGLGPNWKGDKDRDSYRIHNNQLVVRDGGVIYWKPTSFGASQEVFATFTQVDVNSTKHSLLLKLQGNSENGFAGVIEVTYDGKNQLVGVVTRRPGQSTGTEYTKLPATFRAADQFGARVYANGEVKIYRNHLTVATVTPDQYDQLFFNRKGGRIGLWFDPVNRARLDDFGGGTVQ